MPTLPAPDTAWYEASTSSLQPVLAVQRRDRDDHRQRGAVGVGDDALGPVAYLLRVDLGDDQRHVRVHPERAGVVDRDRAPGGGDRRPLRRHLVRHVEHGHVDAVEDLRLQRLDLELLAAYHDRPAGRSG